jgi:hypothetical protein
LVLRHWFHTTQDHIYLDYSDRPAQDLRQAERVPTEAIQSLGGGVDCGPLPIAPKAL